MGQTKQNSRKTLFTSLAKKPKLSTVKMVNSTLNTSSFTTQLIPKNHAVSALKPKTSDAFQPVTTRQNLTTQDSLDTIHSPLNQLKMHENGAMLTLQAAGHSLTLPLFQLTRVCQLLSNAKFIWKMLTLLLITQPTTDG